MKAENITGIVWQPFELESYQLKATFSAQERLALSTPQRRGKYLLQKPVPAFLRPFYDIATRSGIKPEVAKITILAVLAEAACQDLPSHLWTEAIWQKLYQRRHLGGPLLAAFAFHLPQVPLPLYSTRCRQPAYYACAVFGRDIFQQELSRLMDVLVALGYSLRHQEMFLSAVLGMLMLENGDPRLESFTEELLLRGQQYRTNGIARAVGKVSHGLAAHGNFVTPIAHAGLYRLERETN